MTTPIMIVAGDYGYSFHVGVTQDGRGKALAGYDSVRLLVWDEFAPGDILWILSGEVLTSEVGLVSFTLDEGDCDRPGVYCCEVEMSSISIRESSDTYRLLVKESPKGGAR